MPVTPNTNLPGYLFVSRGTGQNDGIWVPFTDSKEYLIQGTLGVPSGATNYLGPHIAPWNGQLLSVSLVCRAGSGTLDINQNGTAVTGLTSLAFGTGTPNTYTPTNTTLVSVGDLMATVIDTVSSADNLTVSFVYWIYL